MAIDPVCKMNVDENDAQHMTVHDGKTYYFCAEGCKNAFVSKPGDYIGQTGGHHGDHSGHGH